MIDREVARRYAAGGLRGRPTGRLYRLIAPPAALLAGNTERDEAEYIVDTDHTGIRIDEEGPDAA